LAFLLLHSLPTSLKWESFKSSTINAVPSGQNLDFDDISERLIAEVTRVEGDAEENTPAESALKTSKPPKRLKSNKWCEFHKSTTHNTDECKTLAAQEASGKGKRKKKGKWAKAHRADDASDSDSGSEASSDSSSSSEDERANSTKSRKGKSRSHHVKVSKALMTRIQAYVGAHHKSSPLEILIDSGASGHM
ncbi:hypothetical protein DFH07DRAFT_720965, partial [Mycena maculata]